MSGQSACKYSNPCAFPHAILVSRMYPSTSVRLFASNFFKFAFVHPLTNPFPSNIIARLVFQHVLTSIGSGRLSSTTYVSYCLLGISRGGIYLLIVVDFISFSMGIVRLSNNSPLAFIHQRESDASYLGIARSSTA